MSRKSGSRASATNSANKGREAGEVSHNPKSSRDKGGCLDKPYRDAKWRKLRARVLAVALPSTLSVMIALRSATGDLSDDASNALSSANIMVFD